MVRKHPILIVEDNPEDWVIMQRALKKNNLKDAMIRMKDGDETLDYLYHRGAFKDPVKAPRPAIILLDLNLPGTGGLELLTEIKNNPTLRSIPVIILTTSGNESDINACYACGANSYIKKPVDMEGFIKTIAGLRNYWFEIVVLPKGEDQR